MMALRVARGLFRLWLVLSVLWVGVVTWWTFPSALSMLLDPEVPPWAVEPARDAVWFATLLALIPPAFVLALGAALLWAFRGFR
jgi:hypothetical protein